MPTRTSAKSEAPPPSPGLALQSINTFYQPIQLESSSHSTISIRDDVRRTLFNYKFQPSTKLFTSTKQIFQLYLKQTNQIDNNNSQLQSRFNSALGRVLRPPQTADNIAKSYGFEGLVKWNSCINMISPYCNTIDPKQAIILHKNNVKQKALQSIKDDQHVLQLREKRKKKKQQDQSQNEQQELQHISFRYVDEFVQLNCATDLLDLKVFPNGKEMAESMSAFSTVRQYLHKHKSPRDPGGPLSFSDPNILLLAVGDGVTPRTAALFAYRTNWKCVSIDPAMRSGAWDSVNQLTTYRARVQDIQIKVLPHQQVLVIMWHCHTSIMEALSCLKLDDIAVDGSDARLRKRVAVVSCACCNFDQVQSSMPDGSPPDYQFEDIAVPGLMRTVRVWEFLQ